MKKEKKAKASKVRRLQQKIQSGEGSKTCEITGASDIQAEFQTCLARMAVFIDSLTAVRKNYLALADIEGILTEITLLRGEEVSSLDTEEARLLSHKEEADGFRRGLRFDPCRPEVPVYPYIVFG